MRNILKTAAICASLALLIGCEKDEEKATMNANARVEANLSATDLVLDKAQANNTALTVTWETKDLGVQLAPIYIVELKNPANGKSKPLSAESSPFTLTVKELNVYLVELGLRTGVASDVKVAVKAALSNQRSLLSEKTIKVTPYFDEIKPSEWGVVGSATPNGWNGPDIEMWNASNGTLVAYATLTTGDIKFRKNNKWDVNLGGSNGTLTAGGANIAVTAGTYKITINVSRNTYAIEAYSWGVIGDGARGWNTDVAMSYEGSTNSWVVKNITLDGQIKFRLNHSWDTDFGADSTEDPATALEGNIVSGGKNIKVPAGNYDVSFSYDANNKGTYKIVRK